MFIWRQECMSKATKRLRIFYFCFLSKQKVYIFTTEWRDEDKAGERKDAFSSTNRKQNKKVW